MKKVIAICIALLMICIFGYSSISARADTNSGWAEPILLENENYNDANSPQIAMDNIGIAHAVWSQYDGTGWNIWTKRFNPQFGWSARSLLSHPFYGIDAANPRIDCNSKGDAVAVWEQHDGASYKILANYYIDGIGWDYPYVISANDSDNIAMPKVAIDDNGNVIAVWSVDIGPYNNLVAARYEPETGWSSEVPIEFNDLGSAWDPDIAFDGNGNAIVVWTQFNGTSTDIWASSYELGSGWSIPEPIDNSSGQPYIPRVATDIAGNAIAVWYQTNATRTDVWANRYTTSSGWGNAILLETEDLGNARVPVIVLDEWGDGIAVWEQSNGSARNIFARPYEFGQGWNTTVLVSAENVGDYAVVPDIAIDGNGNAMATWKQKKEIDVRNDLWACRFVKGVGWERSELIETENRPGASDPYSVDVAMDTDGNAIAIWRHSDGLVDHIWVNRYTVPDIVPPILSITSPEHESILDTQVVTVSGTTEPGVTLNINGVLAAVEEDGSFSFEIALQEGDNTITAVAIDAAGNPTTVSITVSYENPISNLQDELNSLRNELEATKNELNDTQDQLTATESDLDKMDFWRIMSIAGLIAAIIAFLLSLIAILSMLRERRSRSLGPPGSRPAQQATPQATPSTPRAPPQGPSRIGRDDNSLESPEKQPPRPASQAEMETAPSKGKKPSKK